MEYTLSTNNDINNAVNALRQKLEENRQATAARHEATQNAIKEETKKLFQLDLDSVLNWESQKGLGGEIEPSLSIEGTILKFNLNGRDFQLQRQIKENKELSWKITSANYSQALNS
ncbi:hypothetical protein [Tolypothrix sp. PCC 7601]|uniref:hypothetical protein n=1 Tax=Tolypothrix sp. PCC 7601 TaxID=1188 RepID=UPI0021DFB0CF|nr:hypothetical protein [Tolypothrix sp. PCC 7601]UYD38976.1 hypothetical protein HG267_41395 [Tolypothrix sp. PCC 7601]